MPWDAQVLSVLKVFHVAFAALWVGGSFYFNAVVAPNLAQSTPQTRREFSGRIMGAGLRAGNIIGGFTVLTGLLLYYGMKDGFTIETMSDRLIIFGMLLGLAVLYLINVTAKPTMRRLQREIGDQKPGDEPSPVVMLLQKRLQISGRLGLVLLMLALVVMTMADTHVLD